MKIADFLSPADILLDFPARSRNHLLREAAAMLAVRCGSATDEVTVALVKREELGSTGMGNGVAIPHARLATVTRPAAVLARLDQPIDFDAIDGQPVDLVCTLLLPAAADQLGALAAVARRLRATDGLRVLRRARDAAEFYAAFIA